MRWIWVPILALLVTGTSYFWLLKDKAEPKESKDLITQIQDRTGSDDSVSRPVKLEAKSLETPDEKLKSTQPLLRAKLKAREEVKSSPHETPNAWLAAGAAVGEIEEMEAKFPLRKEEFLRYYKDCYESNETMTVTRVQCLKRFVKSASVSDEETGRILLKLPRSVQNLYRKAESIR